ncbi:SAM hydrolase/SAM-dependent halogenase family protein [Schleiferilactobacillus perolens]|jgi:S-adenosylmethionine hydrolase|uniref:SAM hydrolase/SAM-dependent halogenase family protein n=1 Tax=Schleiferilactobacillus perolens TaxID=100468 RepID=UPI0023526DB1|nr:SAM-dependent chlorinase/fluorinase [Schleiferilactobacillus perolens]MCI2172152.1 SAM-dependent chlorinase/fluorinase [Schleiferilactobacillus perolens]
MAHLVLQTDFGLMDGSVSAMYGIAYSVAPSVAVHDLTHNIPPYDIFAASYRLYQTVRFWPAGTVFVSVVDPGVSNDSQPIAVETMDHKFIITPDNGTITHLAHYQGLRTVRMINTSPREALDAFNEEHTFRGRDLYTYIGAMLASNQMAFDDVGPLTTPDELVQLALAPVKTEANSVTGAVDITDPRFGSVWTNIPVTALDKLGLHTGDSVNVSIYFHDSLRYQNTMRFTRSFSSVVVGEPLVYVNSLLNLGIAINQASFAHLYHIHAGIDWVVTMTPSQPQAFPGV